MKSNLSSGKSSAGAAERRAGAVDQDVDAPASATTSSAAASHGRLVGDVEVLDDGRGALVGDDPGDPFGAGVVDVGEDDGHAGLGEADRDRLAEAAAATGDDGDAAGEVEDVADVVGGMARSLSSLSRRHLSRASLQPIVPVQVGPPVDAGLDRPELARERRVRRCRRTPRRRS